MWGQTFTSNSAGAWSTAAIWNRPINGSCVNHSSPPPISASTGCEIYVVVNHAITRANGAQFNQRFRSLQINSAGNLNFTGNSTIQFVNNDNSNLEVTVNGGTLQLYNLELSNGASIRVINGGRLIVRNNLTTGGGTTQITVDAASSISVTNDVSIASNHLLNINGAFSAKNFTSNSAITTVGSTGTLTVSNNFNLLSSGSLSMFGNARLIIEKDYVSDGAASLTSSNNSRINIGGTFSLKSGLFQISENSQLKISGNANHSGGNFSASGYSDIRIGGNLLSTGGIFNGSGNSFLQVAGSHTVTNYTNNHHLSNNAQIQVNGSTTDPWASLTVIERGCYKSANRVAGAGCVLCGATYTTDGTFTVPAGVTSLTIEVWGAGGAGGSAHTAKSGGGGGGAYSKRTVAVTPAQTFYIYTGRGAIASAVTATAGGISYVSENNTQPFSSSLIFARGGNTPTFNSTSGASGGAALTSTELAARPNSISYKGGNGASAGDPSGGGGSAAANNANGNNGQVENGGADPPGAGGPGGRGSYWNTAGSPPLASTYGGGGGGASGNTEARLGGNGADGLVLISFTCPETEPCSRVIDYGLSGQQTVIEYFCNGTWTPPPGLKEFGITAIGGGGGGAAGNIAYGGRGGQINSTSGSGVYFDINKKGNNALGLPAGTIFNINVGEGGKGGTLPSNGLAGNSSSVTGSFVDYSGNTISYNHIALGGNGGSTSFTPTENGLSIPASVPHRRPALTGTYGASGGSTIAPAAGTGGGGNGNNNGPGSSASRNSGSGGGGGTTGGGAGGSGKVFIYYPVFRILPVEFLSFTATYQSDTRSGLLNWATAKEWENEGFDIQRSVNNVRDWETIGQVQGAGYSDKRMDYAYQDLKLPLTGGNIFYRLKQRDYDGDSSYSDTKSIQVEKMPGTSYWRVFPNPTSGDPINLELLDSGIYRDEPVIVRIISASGHFDVVESRGGPSLSVLVSHVLKGKATGVYTIEISWNIYREYHKIILSR